MSFFSLLLISISLAMDCLAVSFSISLSHCLLAKRKILGMALSFGFFQGGMTLLGNLIGNVAKNAFSTVSIYVASAILALLGLKMIYNSLFSKADKEMISNISVRQILLLSIATSIDAFAVGISLAIIKTPIVKAALIIGLTSFIISILGAFVGCFSGKKLKNRIPDFLGGLILIIIGIKMLF